MSATLADIVKVSRRFTRSVRVDTDIGDPAALDGYICPTSALEALLAMARHRRATGHSAFTWTGPYGSGKSSLAVALAALLQSRRAELLKIFPTTSPGVGTTELFEHFRDGPAPWVVCPVVGQRGDAEAIIGEIIKGQVKRPPPRKKDEFFASWVGRVAERVEGPGLALIVDEMGKFLEHAALEQSDIHVFQDLAEIASRSNGRLILVGVLHQAFDEYAQRLSRESRDEWLKIQGRYLDLPVNLAADEQIDLIARAIEGSHDPSVDDGTALIAAAMRGGRETDSERLAIRLADCWPLHPLTAGLLGPISRRRFGQSQRSIFGFLTSAEPFGFQDFLAKTEVGQGRFSASQLWDYLRANLESAILASPDGHRWSTAVDAIERCEQRGGSPDHLAAIKTIALLDLFKDRSGLQPTPEIIKEGIDSKSDTHWKQISNDLLKWSAVVFRKHTGAYAIYAGSDFEIDSALDEARSRGVGADFQRLEEQPALRPVLAKRHYEETGALRWFEVSIAPLEQAKDRVRSYQPAPGSAGLFLICVGTNGESKAVAKRIAQASAADTGARLVMVGWTRDSYRLRELTSDLAALEHVRSHRSELDGDAVARREIDARIARLTADLDDQLRDAISAVDWFGPAAAQIDGVDASGPAGLSLLASRLADWRFPHTPKLHNELINRTKPSSSAAGAVRQLLHAMVVNRGKERLGFDLFPPEAGLFVSLLASTGLYGPDDKGSFSFRPPEEGDKYCLYPMWQEADNALEASDAGLTFAELYDLWRAPPFGVRDGLLPVLALAYVLTRVARTSLYLDEVFRPQLDTFFVDRLRQEPGAVRARHVEMTEKHASAVLELAKRLEGSTPIPPTALEVARALVGRVRALPVWAQRTTLPSSNAIILRQLGLKASDPNKLLFEDLPASFGQDLEEVAQTTFSALSELEKAYPEMLLDLAEALFKELRYDPTSDTEFRNLKSRCETVLGLSGNYRLDALATRLSIFTGELIDVEGIASLAANKPPRDWVDRDIDAAKIELAALAQQFLQAEGLAHLKGRGDRQTSVAVYISDPSFPAPISPFVELNEIDRNRAIELATQIKELINKSSVEPEIAIGAIAQLGLSLSSELGGAQVEFEGESRMSERHVLGISGGRDSAALAVYMRQTAPELEIEYFFTDTGKELPEVYEFLGRLEGFLGKPILRLNPERGFDFWLQEYKNFLPSPQTRWCTKQLKIKPFEAWLRPALAKGEHINSYVAIRSDEDYREGYVSGQDNLKVRLPFREAGIDKAGVMEILEAAGLGLPEYYRWRSRSGCTFCFYQQKIEWARLLEEHPEAFEEAKAYEKNALDHGSPFTWSQGESLIELERPERLAEIKRNHEKRLERLRARRPVNPLASDEQIDLDEIYGAGKLCITCHK